MWYQSFNGWAKKGGCAPIVPAAVNAEPTAEFIIPQANFYTCLNKFLDSDTGTGFRDDIVYSGKIGQSDFQLQGYRQSIRVKKIDQVAKQGVQYLTDLRKIEADYGIEGTYSYSQDMLDYELYVVFVEETVLSCGLSFLAVFFVVLFITGSFPVTLLVVLAVVLVDLFLIALIFYWDLTFNTVVVINIVIAIGLAVDYSAHIAATYLTIKAPSHMTDAEKRKYKAGKALSTMGSSVFHGGFSTFLAIITLSASSSYIFLVFFRLWFGIIVFGMSNGFFLLPIILSFIGPLSESDSETSPVDPKVKASEEIEF